MINLTCALLITVLPLLLRCGSKEDPFAIGDRMSPTTVPTQKAVTGNQAGSTPIATPTAGPRSTERKEPTKDELIKFAQWEDNRIKLANWVAAYLIAHGLDHPVRLIDVEDGRYEDLFKTNDVDIVMEADNEWAKQQVDSGVATSIGTVVTGESTSTLLIHNSLIDRAPGVVEFLHSYGFDKEDFASRAATIRGGRLARTAGIVGLTFIKRNEQVWTLWVTPEEADAVREEMQDGNIGLCREWEVYAPNDSGNQRTRVCIDDPSKHGGNY